VQGPPGQASPVPATLPRRLGRRRRNLHRRPLPRRRPCRTARHGTQPVSPILPPNPRIAAARRLAVFVARGLVSRREAPDVHLPDEFPIGSAIRCRILWESDDTAAGIAREAAKAHAIIRAKPREGLSTKPSSFIKAEAERTQRNFDDRLLTEEALAAARQAVAGFLGPDSPNSPDPTTNSPISPEIPPNGEFPGESANLGCENPPEAENGL
jgi:hypothetical protein